MTVMDIILQLIYAMVATAAFSFLFDLPKSQYLYASLSGGIGWVIYYVLKGVGVDAIIYPFFSALTLTLLSRVFAVIKKQPVTLYLLPGIFPIVPGAGIYYTAYYFITNDPASAAASGTSTLKIAGAIAFGIIFCLAIPQRLFHLVFDRSAKRH